MPPNGGFFPNNTTTQKFSKGYDYGTHAIIFFSNCCGSNDNHGDLMKLKDGLGTLVLLTALAIAQYILHTQV